VTSRLSREFRECFARLPKDVQESTREAYKRWKDNHRHPGLRFKPIQGLDNIYSVRIGINWRALGVLKDDTIVWYWIGSHAEYDRIIG
jgi:hypothetical protein